MADILELFRKSGALLDGHFRLTSGLHSPVYFQCALVLQYPVYCRQIAESIVGHFRARPIDAVVSPALGGIVIGQEVGRQLNVRTIFTERKEGTMCLRRGFTLAEGERVLICEDVVTTGGSVFEVIEIVRRAKAEIAGIGFIVDRSDGNVRFGYDQFAMVRLAAQTYDPADCPLCKQNIPLTKPGSRQSG
jgi:orotate phosphoribosyltransferase